MAKGKGVFVSVRPEDGGGWRATISINVTDGGTGLKMAGTDEGTDGGGPAVALARAVKLAEQIIRTPELANLLPPGTVPAISAVRTIAASAKRGILKKAIQGKKLWEHFSGPFKKLAKSLVAGDRGAAVMGLQISDGRPEQPQLGPGNPHLQRALAARYHRGGRL